MTGSGTRPKPNMESPVWRLCNGIYHIKDKRGKKRRFAPNKAQREIIRQVYVEKKKKLFVPKARQLGISTLIGLMILDSLLFGSGIQCSICDFVGANARKKLARVIDFGFECLPEEWKEGFEKVIYNRQLGEWRIRRSGAPSTDDSVVFAGDNARGDTYQLLHLSELGETQVKAPERAREIFEGALETAELEIVIIETTWHGGRFGILYPLVRDAIETPDADKDKDRDYFVLFFPWFDEPKYVNHGNVNQITPETQAYFHTLSIEAQREFSPEQKLWYQKKKDRMGHKIFSAYPSRLEEIFMAPVDGAIYAREIDEARVQGRVRPIPHDPAKPVHTLWDFGAPKNTVVLYLQDYLDGIAIIDADVIESDDAKVTEITGLDLLLPDRVSHMRSKPYRYGTHYLPHDGKSAANDYRYRVTWQQDLMNLGLPGKFSVIPRANDRTIGIVKAKAMFKTLYFDSSRCRPWLEGLAMYRWRPDPNDKKNTKFLNEPIHDFASHLADPLRVLAEAKVKGYYTRDENIMESNIALDPIRLTAIVPKTPSIGIIETQTGDERRGFKLEAGGWLQMWEPPTPKMRYIAALHEGSAQVWRAQHQFKGQDYNPMLVASILTPARYDPDLLTEWAANLFLHYEALVVPTINEREGVVRDLMMRDCAVYHRTVRVSQRNIGRERPARKMGYDLGEQERQNVTAHLIRLFRDDKIVVNDVQWLEQARTFIVHDDGSMAAQKGYQDNHIIASAVALSLIEQASEYELPGLENGLLVVD